MKKLLLSNFTSGNTYFGENYIKHEENVIPHYHNFYEIFFVVNGELDYFYNDKYTKLIKGTTQFVQPHNYHGFFKKDNKFKISRLVNIAFDKSLITDQIKYLIKKSCNNNQNVLIPIQLDSSIFNILVKRALQLQKSNDNIEKTILLYNILYDYFIEYINMKETVKNDVPFWLKNAVLKMKKEENFKTGLQTFIALTNRSQEYLTRQLKKHYNITPTNYINQLRLEYVANRLIKTDEQIISIIYDSGFNNISHFETLFKQKYHVTPSKYRQLNNNLF